VWIWVIGAVLLIVLVIVALAALPSKKSDGLRHQGVSEATQTVSSPNSALSWTVARNDTLSETPGPGVW
jgi:beta-lactamase regulating signal transducer with metallopeptidase domain